MIPPLTIVGGGRWSCAAVPLSESTGGLLHRWSYHTRRGSPVGATPAANTHDVDPKRA